MKGLILKDLYIVRLQLILGSLLGLWMNGIYSIVNFGMATSKDLGTANITDFDMLMLTVIMGLVNYCTIVPLSSFLLNVMSSEAECGWNKFQRTMPVSSGTVIISKIITTAISVFSLSLFCLIFNLISVSNNPYLSLEAAITIPLCIGFLQMLTIIPAFPLGMKLGTKKANGIYLVFVILWAVIAGIFIAISFESVSAITILRIGSYVVLPLLTALITFICYKASRNLIEADL